MTVMLSNLYVSARTLVRTPLNLLLNLVDPPVIVLLYHRVTTLTSDPEMLAVTPDNFRAQMRYLKENYPLVRFEEDWSKTMKPAVAVTFDDGYADNALEALPILEEVGVPATFFVSTGTIDTKQAFWWDELECIIMEKQNLPSSFTLDDGRSLKTWPTGTRSERQEFYQEIVQALKNVTVEKRNDRLSQLRHWAGTEEEISVTHRAMTIEELRLLAKSRWVTIGAHTVTHTRLSSLTPVAQAEEIAASKRHLEAWLSRDIKVFSYPFGRRCDYTQGTVELCRKVGFAKAAANFAGQTHRWTDPYQIPRHLVRNWPLDTFAVKLREFWTR
jgi:peptidoglycan/xylan/chitin deacetylase (PgdA/CDA1 family)